MNPEGNIELYRLLKEWDPLGLEAEDFDYDAEIYDSMEVLHRTGDAESASRGIQQVFLHSFETEIPLEKIRPTAEKGLEIVELYKAP
ncbi:DUF1871 family protein [Salinicoccus luteus]|uniref:DUF1871 family protein n=1 Tax=Salinicoccus luteus TaxID=367840 RepID=UPI0004E1D6D4|nr:DUF1871 family protein [Salinicoccus luteus]